MCFKLNDYKYYPNKMLTVKPTNYSIIKYKFWKNLLELYTL